MTTRAVVSANHPARWLRRAGVALLLMALLGLLPHLTSDTELVRLRHALVLGPDMEAADAQWQPPAFPSGYKLDSQGPSAAFRNIAVSLKLDELDGDWSRAVAIARHLLGGAKTPTGGALRSDLMGTYSGIAKDGRGYCADFVRAFSAIGGAYGLTVRPWAFSFDGFGGHGHIFVEIWNRQRSRWQLLDVFNNYYFTLQDGEPLSALAFHRHLQERRNDVSLHLLHAGARPGFIVEAKAWDYYQRGLQQWYAPWGNNPFTFDAISAVRFFAGVSRALEQLAAIAAGEHPAIRILAEKGNERARAGMHAVQRNLRLCAALASLGLLAWLAAALWLRRVVRRADASIASDTTAQSPVATAITWPAVCLVGPLPPPSGGMANQCEQLQRLLLSEGVQVELVRTNAPYRPAWVQDVPLLRAFCRLLPYLAGLWRALGRADVVHVFANSGWAWHLLAAPALWIARLRGVPVIVNYRGGQADEFFSRAPRFVLTGLQQVALRVTPSSFLLRVFARHGLEAEIIPNIIDLARFQLRGPVASKRPDAPHLIITRNLESLYDIPTGLLAFARVKERYPQARLTIAGTGPELAALQAQVTALGLERHVVFAGRIANETIAALYAGADLMLNPSTADNMPISILEALASGVPVVSTSAGGIPDLVQDGVTALLVPVGDADAMAQAALRVLGDPTLADGLCHHGALEVQRFAWHQVRDQWRHAYSRAARKKNAPAAFVASSRFQ